MVVSPWGRIGARPGKVTLELSRKLAHKMLWLKLLLSGTPDP